MSHFFQEWIQPVNHLTEHNLTFPPHLHDTAELVYVLEGNITIGILQKKYHLNAGDFAVIFPGQLHEYNNSGQNSTVHITIFHISQIQNYAWELEHFHPENPVITKDHLPSDVLMAFRRLRSLPPDIDPRINQAWIHLIMSYLLCDLELSENADSGNTELVARILEYLSVHYMEPITLDSLSRELHVNKYYLSHTFSQKLYMSFTAYVNKLRTEKAMTLLRTTDYSIESIGEMAGFETQRTFNRAFKKMLHLTPSEYRKGQEQSE